MTLVCSLVPYKSFVKNFIRKYFTINEIIKGFVIAILLSNFIFFSFFENLALEFVSPFLAITGFYLLFKANRWEFYHTGFFIGILWFYWVSFSLRFSQMPFLIPFEIIFFGVVYGLIFLVCGWFKNTFLRAFLLLLLSYFYPFNFNWLNLELTLIYGIFEPNLRGLGAVFLAIISYQKLPKFRTLSAILILCLAIQIKECDINYLPFETKLVRTDIPQSLKWDENQIKPQSNQVLKEIKDGIENSYKFIILPESAIVTYLNLDESLTQTLKNYSYQISILLGSTTYEDKKFYNSTYLFSDGQMKRFDKHILVPIGEEIPLPNFIKNPINKIFFDGGTDFSKAKSYSDYKVFNINIRNAICYEATRPEIYQNNPDIMVAVSNNAWFTPSTEPNFQSLFIEYHATKHCTTVYHSVNGSNSEIITPKRMWIKKFLTKINTYFVILSCYIF
ncbi:MAG: apolipoprotein N-acyltransferase [Campylobacter sp.]|nr:apolipoprotein N-acyltransferase [Campylobacter sp.]